MLGGYLIDLLGRRRILLWSILLYGACTFASAYVTSPVQFLLLRCGTFVGVSVEFVAATAWLAELFTHREQREAVIGYTQGFASTGGLLISAAYYLAVPTASACLLIHGGHEAWRYTAISGLIPGHSADRAAAVSAGIAHLETKESRGNSEAAQLRRTLPSGISQDGADYLPDDGLLLRGVVWHVAAFRQNHSRHAGRARPGPRRHRNSA